MKTYRADLHIHTVLSPCGSLEMSPDNIVQAALNKGLDIIGIADHNSTRQCEVIKKLGEEKGLFVLCGAEVNTKEEVHCLAFFEEKDQLNDFQEYLDHNLPVVKNKPALFGDQVWVDAKNNIQGEEERLLIVGLCRSIDEVAEKVGNGGGIFVPAHVDRLRNSVTSQLGFMPPDLQVTALEISRVAKLKQLFEEYKWLKNYRLITNSDAHVPEDIGAGYSILLMEDLSFTEVKMALSHQKGRKIVRTSIKL